MKKTTLFISILLLLSILLSSCETSDAPGIVTEDTSYYVDRVHRITDYEASIVCYVYADSYRGGIDCLPLSDTALFAE